MLTKEELLGAKSVRQDIEGLSPEVLLKMASEVRRVVMDGYHYRMNDKIRTEMLIQQIDFYTGCGTLRFE